MKKYLFCLALLCAGAAHAADDIATANALFGKKSYPQALQMYTKLANGGNVEAQQHLGEMYLYGEAGAVDLAKSEAWFTKAAAKGNKIAIASLEMMKKRAERKADIEYWMSKYDGSELRSGKFRCVAPRIPAMSKQNDEIDALGAKMAVWQECYNKFVQNLNDSSPLTKLIPKDVADLMTKDENEQATRHLAGVHSRIAEDAKVSSKLVLADFAAWRDATDKYVSAHNEMVKDAKSR